MHGCTICACQTRQFAAPLRSQGARFLNQASLYALCLRLARLLLQRDVHLDLLAVGGISQPALYKLEGGHGPLPLHLLRLQHAGGPCGHASCQPLNLILPHSRLCNLWIIWVEPCKQALSVSTGTPDVPSSARAPYLLIPFEAFGSPWHEPANVYQLKCMHDPLNALFHTLSSVT